MKWSGVLNNIVFLKLSVLLTPLVVYAAGGYDDSKFGLVCDKSIKYTEGGFGSLLTAGAGMGAIIAAAMGGFRAFWALLVVSVGSYIVRSYLEVWFGQCS